jgi:DNA-binding protein H-NS
MENPSYICSPFYSWFVELGYPNCDIEEFQDGSWRIVEYLNAPIIPSLTRVAHVIGPIRNLIISKSFIEKYLSMLDIRKKAYHEILEEKSEKLRLESEHAERSAQDFAKRAAKIVAGGEVMDRIAKYGVKEMDLNSIAKHIPSHQKNGNKHFESKKIYSHS